MPKTVEARRLSGAVGAEITGVDLTKLDDETFAAIHARSVGNSSKGGCR